MKKLITYMFLALTTASHTMTLQTIDQHTLGLICYYTDPDGYTDITNGTLKGDILYVTSDQKRSDETLITLTRIEDTAIINLACTNKAIRWKLLEHFKGNKEKESVDFEIYKEPVSRFLKEKSIEFFRTKIKTNNNSWNASVSLDIEETLKNIEYTLTIMIATQGNHKPFSAKSNEEILSTILLECIEKKRSEHNVALVEDIIKTIIGKATNDYLCTLVPITYEETYVGDGVALTCSRKLNNTQDYNLFGVNLFCQLIYLSNIIKD